MADKNSLASLYNKKNFIALAPMAGITDLPFRIICTRMGADIVYTEMISAKALLYKNEKSLKMLKTSSKESPCVVQLFGSDKDVIASAVKEYINNSDFAGIDINMGCPVPKVVKSGEGSALMLYPDKAYDIVRAIKNISRLPVSVKIRSGWNENKINAIEFSALMQTAGADCITVHPRTKEQYYSGHSDWELIRKIKKELKIPVIASGDATCPKAAMKLQFVTGANGIMIGRAALGNPWIFSQIKQYIKEGTYTKPKTSEIIEQIKQHLYMVSESHNERHAVINMRKHLLWYTKGLPNSAKIRNRLSHAESINEVMEILYSALL